MELWQIAAALGVHRPDSERPADDAAERAGFDTSGFTLDDHVAEMKAAALAQRETGSRQEWAPPTDDDVEALDRLDRYFEGN